jgi:ribonuclease-3
MDDDDARERAAVLAALQARLGHRFADPDLLETALTHSSHAHERRESGPRDYERLELLGDALLGFVVTDWLVRDDREASEGVLSRRRQAVVRAASLSAVAERLGLGAALRLGRGEELSGGRAKPSLLADVLEAVLGAIYVDGGVRAARAFVQRHLGAALRELRGATAPPEDYKTELQERIQGRLQRTPRYRIVATAGPDHALEFEAEVVLGGKVLGRGRGSNRKRAEQAAAREALSRLALEE